MDEPPKISYCFGPFRLDPHKRILFKDEEPVQLAPKALDLLLVLVANRDRVLVKDELMEKVWPDQIVEDANITVNMSALRKALGENRHEHLYIVTIPGRGYRFIGDVHENDVELNPIAWEQAGSALKQDEPAGLNTFRLKGTALDSRKSWRAVIAFAALLVIGVLAYLFIVTRRVQPGTGTIKSIAVLPFKPVSEGSRDEYLELGMADSLITRLSGAGETAVRPISATRKYTDFEQDPLVAGRELKVEAVLEGTIQKFDERVRVTLRLVRVADGNPVWAGQFDAGLTDILALEDSVSERVARALAPKLRGVDIRLLAKHYTDNVDAYQSYLKGRYQMSYWTADGLVRAVESFQHAIEKDPEYALAYAGLADAHSKLGFGSGASLPAEEFSKARAAATRALELDSTLADAHVSLAEIAFHFDWNWSDAERHYQRAIELNANLATAHEGYSQYLTAMGRTERALSEIKLAEQLDPLSLVIKIHKGLVLHGAGEYEQAIVAYREALELEPKFGGAHALLGWVYEKQKKYEAAITELQEASRQDPSPSWRLAGLARAYALSGKRDQAIKTLDQLKELRNDSYASPFYIAEIYTALGDKDRAFEWLERAYKERDSGMAYLKVEDSFESLSSDPRFRGLLQRMNFTP
jgi:DNA-binding winged helix-turn-helix (wHTH) protein/tetratricopeptide (TPR) repeat protein